MSGDAVRDDEAVMVSVGTSGQTSLTSNAAVLPDCLDARPLNLGERILGRAAADLIGMLDSLVLDGCRFPDDAGGGGFKIGIGNPENVRQDANCRRAPAASGPQPAGHPIS